MALRRKAFVWALRCVWDVTKWNQRAGNHWEWQPEKNSRQLRFFVVFFDRILMFTKRSLLLVFPLEIDGTIPPVLGGSLWVRMVDNTLCFCCVFMFQCSVNWKSLTAHFHVDIGREIVQLLECTRVLPMGVTPEGLQNGCLGCDLAFPLPEKSDPIL